MGRDGFLRYLVTLSLQCHDGGGLSTRPGVTRGEPNTD